MPRVEVDSKHEVHSSFNRSFFWHRFARAAFRRFVNQPCSCVIKTNDTLDSRQYEQQPHLQCTYGPGISSRIQDWALGAGGPDKTDEPYCLRPGRRAGPGKRAQPYSSFFSIFVIPAEYFPLRTEALLQEQNNLCFFHPPQDLFTLLGVLIDHVGINIPSLDNTYTVKP